MKKLLFILSLLCSVMLLGEPRPQVRIPAMPVAPEIDGVINDSEWKNASGQYGTLKYYSDLLTDRQAKFFLGWVLFGSTRLISTYESGFGACSFSFNSFFGSETLPIGINVSRPFPNPFALGAKIYTSFLLIISSASALYASAPADFGSYEQIGIP